VRLVCDIFSTRAENTLQTALAAAPVVAVAVMVELKGGGAGKSRGNSGPTRNWRKSTGYSNFDRKALQYNTSVLSGLCAYMCM